MRLPWVSRARYEAQAELAQINHKRLLEAQEGSRAYIAERRREYQDLLDKYHALRVSGANAPAPTEPITIEEPDLPPEEVLAAMTLISPIRDATYEANWQFWERNKERAKKHPKDFADEILKGR